MCDHALDGHAIIHVSSIVVTAIQLGVDENIPSVLPSAFYVLNSTYHAGSGFHFSNYPSNFDETLSVSFDPLTNDSLRRLMRGREWLRRVLPELMRDELPHDVHRSARCILKTENLSPCWPATLNWFREEALSIASWSQQHDPLRRLEVLRDAFDDGPSANISICAGCRKAMKTTLMKARRYLWEELSVYFGLEKQRFLTPWNRFW
jgi:hypothetical protein